MPTRPLTDLLAALTRHARGLIGLLPGSAAFRAAGIGSKLKTLFYATAFFAIAAIGAYGYFNASVAYRERAVQLLESNRNEVAANIDEFMALQRNDLGFINNFYAILRFAYWKDLGDTAKMEEWRNVAGDTLRNFAENFHYYSKIRLVTLDGEELLHVVTDNASGKARVLDDNKLLNVAELDYFIAGRKLKRGELYVSALDFGRKEGLIEKPPVPVVRFIQPLVGDNNVSYGLTISNIRASAIYDYIRKANKNDQGRQFTLIDSKGNYLFHPDADKQFGHLLGHGYNFDKDHHNLIAEMHGKTEGVITRGGHIHVFHSIVPNPRQPDLQWFLVGVVDESVALAELNTFMVVFFGLLITLILIIVAATRYMSGQLMTPLQFVNRQLELLARGETQPDTLADTLDYPARDDIRQMLDSTERVVANMATLAQQADAIAGGDFSGQVVPLSENDRLGNALNNMTRQLADNQRDNTQRNWLKDGLAELGKTLTGDLTPQRLAELAISQVGRTLEAGRGVLYVWSAQDNALDLLGSYMYTERNALGARVRLGEGAVGQVARELKPIILHASDAGAQAELPPINTGTSSVRPQVTYTWPLQREGVLHGVLEIARSAVLDPTQLDYLNAAAESIAAFLYAVLQKSRIKELLLISEEATRQAQEQSRQLQITNTQMEEQQQQLQQQTAELQAANSQMEEQQQQLMQQTAELQATNGQMEEQQQQLQQQAAELQAANSQMEEAQQTLELRNRDLLQSQEELDARAQKLELSSKYKSEFLANMSHELRTPLNSIILLSKLMASNEDDELGEEAVKRVEVIHRAGQDLLRLINDVLDLSKVEAGRMDLHSAPVASSALAEEFRDLFTAPAKDKGLELLIEDAIDAKINVDRDKLSQIVRNLLSNALKFTRQGSVVLRFERRPEETLPLTVSVRDTGIGVAADKQALIFEAFQQADGSTSREYGGTGLGLSISLSFAHLMGGNIDLTSSPGVGSTFTLRLPETPPAHTPHHALQHAPHLLKAGQTAAIPPTPTQEGTALTATAAPRPPAEPWPADDRTQIGGNDPVLLLIDDDPVFAQAILDINRRLGYKTLLAPTGSSGLDLARRFAPSGILLDLGLPDMDGSAVLHRLKSTAELAAIPIYIISGRDRDNALLGEGALGWLHKPVDAEQIARVEAEVLSQSASNTGRDLLLVTAGALSAAEIAPLLGQDEQGTGSPGKLVTLTANAAKAKGAVELLAGGHFRVAILDLGSDPASQATARAIAAKLRAAAPDLGLLFYGCSPLGDEADASLRQYSDSIIIKTPQSERRLQENIAHFLQKAPQRRRGHAAPSESAGSGKKRLAGRHILVVDDDPRNLFVIAAALEQQGAKVDSALNGRKALEILVTLKPDLVIMDIMMPEMDGYQTIEAMRANAQFAAIPIVALTAKALPSDREKALAAGADDYLAKPADYEVLVNMAAAWCEGRR
jgi:signal transduction histidine kinase/DNA-binding response OmpR family regulator